MEAMSGASALKQVARTAFHKAGGLGMARWMNRKGLRILMYHRFSDREALVRQCVHMRAHYAPIAMTQVADWLERGAALPENALAITVDDGYRDFYRVAYPVFREYEIPATVYLVSEFVDRKLWLWVDQVRYAFLHGQAQSFRYEARDFDLATREARKKAAYVVTEALKRIPNDERLRFLTGLAEQLQAMLPPEAPAEHEPMRWDEVREMSGAGIEFGAHTRTHPILSRVTDAKELVDEIAGSKRRIEQELGRPVDHFCYPNGSREDFGSDAVDAVRSADFRTAVTTEKGLNYSGANRFELVRIGVEPGLEEEYFAQCAAGFRV